jgi:hypothetical protein
MMHAAQVMGYEIKLGGGDGATFAWVTSVLTLLANLVLCYQFYANVAFKIHDFLDRHEMFAVQQDAIDPYSISSLSSLWFGTRILRLVTATLKLDPIFFARFIVELAICSIHAPAMTYRTVLVVQASGEAAAYTSETYLLAIMFLRLYVLGKVARSHVALRYSSAKCVLPLLPLLPIRLHDSIRWCFLLLSSSIVSAP